MNTFLSNLRLFIFLILGGCFLGAFANSYKVGAGDIIQIQVISELEFSGFFQVGTDGTIDYPFIRKLSVIGLDVEQVDELLTGALKKGYLKDPQIFVSMKEYQSQKVLVFGSINRPGPYILSKETKLLDLISLAGGLSGAGGKQILLFREKNKETAASTVVAPVVVAPLSPTPHVSPTATLTQVSIPNMIPTIIDYFDLVNNGKMNQNIVLQDGDIINVPKANEILVLGNVVKPGPLKYEDRMTLLQAVTLSGGPSTTASTKNTYVLRQGPKGEEKISVRLDKILESKAPNFVLEADDVVVIPESFF